MKIMNRRSFMKWVGRLSLGGFAAATYGLVIEPGFRLVTQTYAFTPPHWTPGLKLRVAILADPHLVEPHMTLNRWQRIVETANALNPDIHLLLGDYVAGHFWRTGTVKVADGAKVASALRAPLGTFGICGNHDWWDDLTAQRRGQGPTIAEQSFLDVGIPMLENKALRLNHNGSPFWLTGTSSIVAIKKGRGRFEGRDDLKGTLAQVTDDAPIIHLAHEPDLFVNVPARVSLTLSGHTHGGQVRILGYSPLVPSRYGNRFARGHIVEDGRHLVVSAGLGCSIFPVRFGSPPEITVLELG